MKTLKHFFMLNIFCMISLGASAEVYYGWCGDNAQWTLDTETGLLSITGSGNMTNYDYYSHAPWYDHGRSVISLSIGDQITSIGDNAFSNCSGLTSVTIPNSVTSIGDDAFWGCKGLTSVTIPNSVTWIGGSAFYGCSGLTSVTIPNSVTSIGGWAFDNCSGLTSVGINIVDWANKNVVATYSELSNKPFFYTYNGKKIEGDYTIPDSVTTIGDNALYKCKDITKLIIPNSVTSIGNSAFYGCLDLISVTIPNSVTSIGNDAFSSCKGLTSVTIPNSVTSIGSSAFWGCSGLTSVTIGNSVTEIEKYAFYGCYFLSDKFVNNSSLNAESNNYWGATICDIRTDDGLCIKDNIVIKYCGNGTSVTIPNSVTSIGDGAFYGCLCLTSIEIPNSVTSIGSSAFYGCSGLTSVTIPNSVTSIGSYAFSSCYFLSDKFVNNSSLNAESNNYWGATICDIRTDDGLCIKDNIVIKYCGNGTSVTIGNSVTSIGEHAFYSCSGLKSVTIPNSVTSIGSSAFYGCSGLTSLTIPNSVTSIGDYAFYYCSGLTSVTIGNSVTSIGEHAFYSCSGLKSVTIPNSVTSIGELAFAYCSGLTSVTIPNSVTSIGTGAFDNCSGLTSVTIPNSVISIGDGAFYGCSGLTSVTIPNSVTKIGGSAFSGCSGLRSVYVGWKDADKIPSITANDFDFSHSCELYVPIGTSTIYQLQNYWRWFDILEYLPEEEAYLTIMGVNGVILQQAVETGKTYKYLLDNKKNGKIVSFNGEDVTADVTDGKYTTPKITGNSEIYVEYDNQPLGDTNLDGKVNVNDITATAEIILLKAKAEIEAKAAMESIAEP